MDGTFLFPLTYTNQLPKNLVNLNLINLTKFDQVKSKGNTKQNVELMTSPQQRRRRPQCTEGSNCQSLIPFSKALEQQLEHAAHWQSTEVSLLGAEVGFSPMLSFLSFNLSPHTNFCVNLTQKSKNSKRANCPRKNYVYS